MTNTSTSLKFISPDKIIKNPENPRLIFRADEMDQLLESIKEVGIKVPITVYRKGSKYVILDGERRWRCSLKLNLKEIPAIIHPTPTRLENLLMMFNIHNVRVQWDLMPTALKLKDVKKLLEKTGEPVTNKSLATVTGLSVSQVARGMELLELPKRYQDALIKESEKPKSEQKITPDLFLEIIKSKKAIEKYVPEVFSEVNKKAYLDLMFEKYQKGTINNVVKFRDISKIARAEAKGVNRQDIVPTIVRIAKEPGYKIENAYKETAEVNYKIRDIRTKITSLMNSLEDIKNERLPKEILDLLLELRNKIDAIAKQKK